MRAEDGTSLAYAVHGAGDLTILLAYTTFFSHIDRDWEQPGRARFFDLLAGFARVILTDRRNMGMSDPGPPTGTLEVFASDLITVLDATDTEKASLVSLGSPSALALPVVAPERIDSVVLHNVTPRFGSAPDFPHGVSPRAMERYCSLLESDSVEPDFWVSMGTSSPAQHGLSPGNAGKHARALFGLDARAYVPRIAQRTLVVRSEESALPRGSSTWMADHLPNSTLVDLPGRYSPFDDDLDLLVGTLEDFLTGRRTARAHERSLATIVFTDIVGSTRLASQYGPSRWRRMLDTHDRLTKRAVERHGGSYVKSTGDGALAVFALPDAALAAVAHLHHALGDAGTPIRAGVHVGVVEQRGTDIAGLAVHTAARIGDLGEAGQTVVSAGVLDGAPSPEWRSLGAVELKGIEVSWPLYRTGPHPDGGAPPETSPGADPGNLS